MSSIAAAAAGIWQNMDKAAAAASVRADADRLRAEMEHGVATAKAALGRPPG